MLLDQPREPVPGFGLKFRWHTGHWERIFEAQRDLIRTDIKRARLDGKIVVYMSCPISARGGGHARTNVEIAKHTERRLLDEWGEQFWLLNPCQYQLESKEGFGLMDEHADKLKIDLTKLLKDEKPTGGDYMRMWTQVLVEDGPSVPSDPPLDAALKNTGRDFAAYYFVGPDDARAFFGAERKGNLGAAIEEYFARKHSTDIEFRNAFSVREGEDALWAKMRKDFLIFYALRTGVQYSLGSHDEWAIFTLLNRARRHVSEKQGGGIPNQIAGFFDGRQLAFAAGELAASGGYSVTG